MFTIDSLLETAVSAMTERQIIIDNEVRESGDHRCYDLYLLHERALQCAEWMETNNIKERSMIGPFGNVTFNKGQKVRIKKDAIVHGTGKAIPAGGKKVVRPYCVTVFNTDQGWVGNYRGEIEVRDQQVHWVGESGYWRWTDANNVECV